jgi:predicted permease
MLARATARQRELAIRGALGAGRGRIMRQLVTESALLAGLGMVTGLLLAYWTVDFLAVLAPTQLAGIAKPAIDFRALGFAFGAMLLATGIVGLTPAWWMSQVDLRTFLQGGRLGGRVLHRTRSGLLVAQLALATALLVGAGLLQRSMAKLHETRIGFDSSNLLTASAPIPRLRYTTIAAQMGFIEQLRPYLEAIPGVTDVTFTSDGVVATGMTFSYVIAGQPRPGPNPREEPVEMRAVTTGYFKALRLPILAGRAFDASDRGEQPSSAIVNQAFAKLHFPDGRVLGQRLSLEGHAGPWYEIVGVTADVKDAGLEAPAAPAFYVPYLQKGRLNLSGITALIRTTGDPGAIREDVRRAFIAVDPENVALRIVAMPAVYLGRLEQRNFLTRLTSGFAFLTLTLGVIGVYGVISYSVAQRRRDFGIQLALGATPARIVRHVLNGGLKLIAIGALLGGIAALSSARLLGNLLYEIEPLDPITLFFVVGLLGTVSLLALWLPARAASKSDPMVALRCE